MKLSTDTRKTKAEIVLMYNAAVDRQRESEARIERLVAVNSDLRRHSS